MLKKVISLALISAMAISLVSCTEKKKEENKIELSYINWNLATEQENNLERRMIQAYEEKNPDVKINIIEPDEQYSEYLTTLASAGTLPDVMMIDGIPQYYANKWLKDVSEYVANDSEWETLPATLKDSACIGGTPYAVPFAMHMQGGFINTELFEQAGVPELSYGYTWDEFAEAMRKMTQPSQGMVGLKEETGICEWYAHTKNPAYGWFTFDGSAYHLDSPEFAEGIEKTKQLYQNGYVYAGLSEEDQAKFQAQDQEEAWLGGKVAMDFAGTYILGGYGKTLNFDLKFVGLPDENVMIIPDYLGMSASTQHPEEAYDFMKWMSFGKEGYAKRLEIAKEMGEVYISMPMTTDENTLNEYLDFIPIEGLGDAYKNIDRAAVSGLKFIPGANESRYTASTGLSVGTRTNANIGDMLWDCVRTGINYADYAEQMNNLANSKYQEVLNSLQ